MTLVEPTTRKWTRDEYYQLADMGFFQGQRVELIDGEIIEMAPQKDFHAIAIGLIDLALREAFGFSFWIRQQLPLSLANISDPEPDVSIIRGKPRDFTGKGHPSTAALVVEVSDTTLSYDRGRKASLYAAAGVEDYWILDLNAAALEVRRDRIADSAEPHGFRYATITTHPAGDAVVPLAAPQSRIAVADMLP